MGLHGGIDGNGLWNNAPECRGEMFNKFFDQGKVDAIQYAMHERVERMKRILRHTNRKEYGETVEAGCCSDLLI